MKWGFGSFRSEESDNFALTGGQTTVRRGQNYQVEAIVKTLDFSFTIHGASQTAVHDRYLQVVQAIRGDGYDVGFYLDNGNPSAIFLQSSTSTTGVMVTKFPQPEPDVAGADYATSLKGSLSVMAEYLPQQLGFIAPGGGAPAISDYEEELAIEGNGGPRVALQEYDVGDPTSYILCDKTYVFATQSGALSVLTETPTASYFPNPPLWPNLLINESEATRQRVRRRGKAWELTLNWNYRFQSVGPLFGTPTLRQ